MFMVQFEYRLIMCLFSCDCCITLWHVPHQDRYIQTSITFLSTSQPTGIVFL